MLCRSALALVALTGAAAITPLCAQQLDSLPAQDSVLATSASAVRTDTVQPASSSSPQLGPRLSPQFQSVRPQLGPSTRSEGSSFMDDDDSETITISTVTLLLVIIIVILLVK